MTFEEALDALLREYNKDDWEITIRTLFKAIDKVADSVSRFVADPIPEHQLSFEEELHAAAKENAAAETKTKFGEPDPLGGPGPSTDHKVF